MTTPDIASTDSMASSALRDPGAPTSEEVLPEVVRVTRDLIRFDTSNHGDGRARGEGPVAEYIAAYLRDRGLEPVIVAPDPGEGPVRPSVFARWGGDRPDLPPILVHGHMDVVPARPEEWSVDPFAGEIRDGMLWGRGALDMKDMLGMMLASVDAMVTSGRRPRRDVILGFLADEEAGGARGAEWIAREHPELVADATVALSEVGGYTVTIGGRRAWLLQTGEKGHAWVRLTARGSSGHASAVRPDNAVTAIARAVAGIGAIDWPVELTETTRALLDGIRRLAGLPEDAAPERVLAEAGPAEPFLAATLRSTTTPTVIDAGFMQNVVPATAEARIDVRPLPGADEKVLDRLREAAGDDVTVEVLAEGHGYESPFSGPFVDAVRATIAELDPEAVVLPYLLNAGTDNVALRPLGLAGYGFVPMRVPDGFDLPGGYHAVDERVPLDTLAFGRRTLTALLERY